MDGRELHLYRVFHGHGRISNELSTEIPTILTVSSNRQ